MKNNWIYITTKRLPKVGQQISMLFDNDEVSSGEYCEDEKWYDYSIQECVYLSILQCKVIAWQPLPKSPNKNSVGNQEDGMIDGIIDRSYQIDFGQHMRTTITVRKDRLEIHGGLDGWGNVVPDAQIKITEKTDL